MNSKLSVRKIEKHEIRCCRANVVAATVSQGFVTVLMFVCEL